MKEMDYQFRIQEEGKREKRDRQRTEREEEHYKKLDELIKQYSGRGLTGKERRERKKTGCEGTQGSEKEEKRKKHSTYFGMLLPRSPYVVSRRNALSAQKRRYLNITLFLGNSACRASSCTGTTSRYRYWRRLHTVHLLQR